MSKEDIMRRRIYIYRLLMEGLNTTAIFHHLKVIPRRTVFNDVKWLEKKQIVHSSGGCPKFYEPGSMAKSYGEKWHSTVKKSGILPGSSSKNQENNGNPPPIGTDPSISSGEPTGNIREKEGGKSGILPFGGVEPTEPIRIMAFPGVEAHHLKLKCRILEWRCHPLDLGKRLRMASVGDLDLWKHLLNGTVFLQLHINIYDERIMIQIFKGKKRTTMVMFLPRTPLPETGQDFALRFHIERWGPEIARVISNFGIVLDRKLRVSGTPHYAIRLKQKPLRTVYMDGDFRVDRTPWEHTLESDDPLDHLFNHGERIDSLESVHSYVLEAMGDIKKEIGGIAVSVGELGKGKQIPEADPKDLMWS